MGSAVLPPASLEALKQNMVWDGRFHAAVWILPLIGVYWLLNDARRAAPLPGPKAFTGLLLLGWGLATWSRDSSTTTCSSSIMYGTCRPTSPPTTGSFSPLAVWGSSCSGWPWRAGVWAGMRIPARIRESGHLVALCRQVG